ncbi:hypothetical protein TRIP_C20331 [Candidatus Zixiibacteriota bacterium]|nr:hypothetical protein TRIP_C20331 [candidate division Zixibacteria bacterium]
MPSKVVRKRAAELFNEALRAQSQWDFRKSRQLSAKAYRVAFIAADYDMCIKCLILESNCSWYLGDFVVYDRSIGQAVTLSEQYAVTPHSYMIAHLRKCAYLREQMHFKEAISYANKALRLARKEQDSEIEYYALLALARIHEENYNHEYSLVYCRTAKDVAAKMNRPTVTAEVQYQTAKVLVGQKRFSDALDLLASAEQQLNIHKNPELISDMRYLASCIYGEVGDRGKVEDTFKDLFFIRSSFRESDHFAAEIEGRNRVPDVVARQPNSVSQLESIRLNLEQSGLQDHFPLVYVFLGGSFLLAKNYVRATESYWNAAELLCKLLPDNHIKFFFVLRQLCTCLQMTDNDKSAVQLGSLGTKGEKLFEKTGSVEDVITEKRRAYIHGLPANLHAIRYYLSRYFKWNKITIDFETGEIRKNKRVVKRKIRQKLVPVKLTSRQIRVLRKLAERMPMPVTFDEIVEAADGCSPAAGVPTRDRAKYYRDEICERVGVNFIVSSWGTGFHIPKETAS